MEYELEIIIYSTDQGKNCFKQEMSVNAKVSG
jgi:hypothetical protein